MENSGQSEHTIDLPNTGNHLSESSNDGFGMVTNSTRQDSVNGLSSRYLLPSSPEQIPVDFELM